MQGIKKLRAILKMNNRKKACDVWHWITFLWGVAFVVLGCFFVWGHFRCVESLVVLHCLFVPYCRLILSRLSVNYRS